LHWVNFTFLLGRDPQSPQNICFSPAWALWVWSRTRLSQGARKVTDPRPTGWWWGACVEGWAWRGHTDHKHRLTCVRLSQDLHSAKRAKLPLHSWWKKCSKITCHSCRVGLDRWLNCSASNLLFTVGQFVGYKEEGCTQRQPTAVLTGVLFLPSPGRACWWPWMATLWTTTPSTPVYPWKMAQPRLTCTLHPSTGGSPQTSSQVTGTMGKGYVSLQLSLAGCLFGSFIFK
jgi:hypothetical protein